LTDPASPARSAGPRAGRPRPGQLPGRGWSPGSL